MCQRDDRDQAGRYRPGVSGNPRGRPPTNAYIRLLRAAEAAGATVVVMLPPRLANDDTTPVPPVAA